MIENDLNSIVPLIETVLIGFVLLYAWIYCHNKTTNNRKW